MNEVDFSEVGYIYKFWYKVFMGFENILPFSICRSSIFENVKSFSDKWVVFNTGLSFLALLVAHYFGNNIISGVLILYGAIRVFEIIIYQINVLLFHPYHNLVVLKKKEYKLTNPYRSVVLLGHNFIEVIFWFTATTSFLKNDGTRLILKLMDNAVRIFTFNYEKVAPGANFLQLIFFMEVICGILLTVISLAKFIGELPHIHVKLKTEVEKNEQ